MRVLRPLSIAVIGSFVLAVTPGAAQMYCSDPPALTILTGETVTASGTGSEGHPNGYYWIVSAPPGAAGPSEIESKDPTILVTPDIPGLWSIGLEVSYAHQAPGGGLWTSQTCLTVEAASVVAAIGLSAAQVSTDETVALDGFASRWAAGVTPTVEWTLDSVPYGACNGGPPPSGPADLQCTIPAGTLTPGWYTAGLTLTDPSSGQTSTSTADFEVIEVIPLTVDFTWTPVDPEPTDLIQFTATVDPPTDEGDFTRVVWDMGDGWVETYLSCPPPFFFTCLQYPYTYGAGNDDWYTVTITVETADETASMSHVIEVGDPVALPTASFQVAPASPNVLETTALTFDGECVGTCSWSWDFGDGTGSAASDPSHSWKVPATYQVELTVSNENGSDTTTVPVTVTSCWSPTAPVQTGSCYGGPVTLTAPSGAAWSWSTGASTAAISIAQAGSYWVNIDDGTGCWGHAAVAVSLDNCGSPTGDADLDGVTDAADLAALAVELADGDGDLVVNAGGFDVTAPGGDVTGDWALRTEDLLSVITVIFN